MKGNATECNESVKLDYRCKRRLALRIMVSVRKSCMLDLDPTTDGVTFNKKTFLLVIVK